MTMYSVNHSSNLKGRPGGTRRNSEKQCTVLHCNSLYFTVLQYTALYCTVLYFTVLHCNAIVCSLFFGA